MSDDEEFLARWSRRKHEAKRGGQVGPQPLEAAKAQRAGPADGPLAEPAHPTVDLSSLPPIDSIDAATDIAVFLGNDIPLELRRAALRRAWTTDPAIRDFVGLAENAWDFNDPNAIPGFGSLDLLQAEVSRIVEPIVGGVQQVAVDLPEIRAAAQSVEQSPGQESGSDRALASMPATAGERTPDETTITDLPSALVTPQPATSENGKCVETPTRHPAHGGALPR